MRIALLLLLLSGGARAQWAPPERQEYMGLYLMESMIVLDTVLTAGLVMNQRNTEWNPLLGKHPSPGRVYLMGAAGGLAAAGAWYATPPRWRWFVIVAVGMVEFVAVVNNASVGASFAF